jgi:HAD superfamily hydrolase (TIGR01509 family)
MADSRSIRGVLLDVDGTLVDSNTAHAEAWAAAFAEAGLEAPPVDEIRRMIGMGGDKLLPAAVGLTEEAPLGRQVAERRSEIFRQRHLPALAAAPGSTELVRGLLARGLQVGIATSAQPEELRGLLERARVPQDLADLAASSEDVAASKPDPDVVHAALEQIGLPPEAVVLVGDTPYDVEAAARAGVAVIALRCGGWSDGDLHGAAAVYDDPADLLANLDAALAAAEPAGS